MTKINMKKLLISSALIISFSTNSALSSLQEIEDYKRLSETVKNHPMKNCTYFKGIGSIKVGQEAEDEYQSRKIYRWLNSPDLKNDNHIKSEDKLIGNLRCGGQGICTIRETKAEMKHLGRMIQLQNSLNLTERK